MLLRTLFYIKFVKNAIHNIHIYKTLQLSTIDFDDGSMDTDFASSANNVKSQKNRIDVQNAACKTSVKSMKIGNSVDWTEIALQLVKTKDEEFKFRFYYMDA